MRGTGDYDCGNGVFEDELFLIAGFKDDRILVETLDPSRQFYSTHQIYGQEGLVLSRIV